MRREQYRQRCHDVTVEFRPSDFPVKHGWQFAMYLAIREVRRDLTFIFEVGTADGNLRMNPVIIRCSVFRIYQISQDFGVKICKCLAAERNGGRRCVICKISDGPRCAMAPWSGLSNVVLLSRLPDYMSGTYFSYGVRKMRLYVDGRFVSQVTLQNFLFDEKKGCQ